MVTTLSADKQTATADGEQLGVGQIVDYKLPSNNIISKGKIMEFRLVDPKDMKSVWFRLVDITSGNKEWISFSNWKQQKNEGLFTKATGLHVETQEQQFKKLKKNVEHTPLTDANFNKAPKPIVNNPALDLNDYI